MHDSGRYRDNAAECLLAAEEACQPYYCKLHLSMAALWLSLAHQDEAVDNLFARESFRQQSSGYPRLRPHRLLDPVY
jgi:hypothetical protein